MYLKPLSFHAAIVPVSGAEPGVSSNQSVQINVREKIANEISISKVNCGDGGVTSAAVGYFTFWVEPVCFILRCSAPRFNTMKQQTALVRAQGPTCQCLRVCQLCFGLF